MNIKTMSSFLLLLFACAVEAHFEAEDSKIISIDGLYEDKLNEYLASAAGEHAHWKLCYRASDHGWAAQAFHERCDGKPVTVSIVKVGNNVFGGYADTPWDTTGSYGSTSNAFIFSLHNKEDLGPFKSMVKHPRYSIYKDGFHGPTFGRGYDIAIESNANQHRGSYTEFGNTYNVPSGVEDRRTILAGTYAFSPDEMEVFYLA